ncbi:MAG: phenylalanine--tRNA ligase subunit beta [Clostridia bacterium]|nr:phenylalanine--tRNA ligase subunit beta [Clostridia bacterium]
MNVTKGWLADFVELNESAADIAKDMTMSGSKVETFSCWNDNIERVVVGHLLEVVPHPDSDHLQICQVDVGEAEPIQIITGAQNIKVGDYVPAALDNSLLPNGTKIKKGKLRGLPSNGMLCSLGELNLTTGNFPECIEDGIMILSGEPKPGTPIDEALGLNDPMIEFEITPNRPDCLSVLGLAREAAATYRRPFNKHVPAYTEDPSDQIENYLSVTVEEPVACPRYMAKVVKNVKIGPSPLWLRNRLYAVGVRPINNVVDITNYVMLEYGQPMHAFDYRTIRGKQIKVKMAADNETFTTLDEQERTLQSTMLTIADGEGTIAVAGIMGGLNSEIENDTTTIVFESANFDGVTVRKASRALGLRTDASSRYEKGLDPVMTEGAINRACELAEQLAGGTVVAGVLDVNNDTRATRTITLRPDRVNAFLGTDIDETFMKDSLTMLEFEVDDSKNPWAVTVPSFRDDVEGEADLAEEIVRLYGYDNIPTTLVHMATTQGMLTPAQSLQKKMNETMLACGYSEICTYSFISPKVYDKLLLPADSGYRKSVVISNPLGEDTSVMRTTALGSMLATLSTNYNNRNLEARLFEPATTYTYTGADTLPYEQVEYVLGCYGKNESFYTLKGAVEQLLKETGLPMELVEFTPWKEHPTFHPGKTAEIRYNGEVLGFLGEVHPLIPAQFELPEGVWVADLYFEKILAAAKPAKEYHALPKFPATTRDLAFVCEKSLTVGSMEKVIREKGGNILESVALFDIYEGKQIAAGMKSVAFNLTFRAADRTLSDEEIDQKVKKMVDGIVALGATLRS